MKGVIAPSKEIFNEARYLCEYFNVPMDIVSGKSRKRNIVEARHFIISYLYRYAGKGLSSATIGMLFGDRDHSTILHSCRAIENWRKTEGATQKKWNDFLVYAQDSAITKFDNIPQF